MYEKKPCSNIKHIKFLRTVNKTDTTSFYSYCSLSNCKRFCSYNSCGSGFDIKLFKLKKTQPYLGMGMTVLPNTHSRASESPNLTETALSEIPY